MGHFPLLDVAIGLTLIYAFLSLLVSELTERITTFLQWRANYLQRGIMLMFGEPLEVRHDPDQFKQTITGKLYNSSLIASVAHSSRRTWRSVGPSYLSSLVFADALLEVLYFLPKIEQQTIPDQQRSQQDNDELARFIATVDQSNELPPRLKDNLQRLAYRARMKAKATKPQMEQLRYEIARWYEHSMARLSGTYRRNVKASTIVIGFVVAILINTDSLYILRRISENSATRSIIIQNVAQIQGCQEDLSSEQCMNRMMNLLDSTTMPIGWHPINFQQQFPQFNWFYLLRATIGWLLTGIAISMGSRFWFQILEQFVSVRETGEKPISSEEKESSNEGG